MCLFIIKGGSWDNSDIKTAKKRQWTDTDKKYNANPAPQRVDWMGTVERRGPGQKGGAKKPPANDEERPTRKLFGMF